MTQIHNRNGSSLIEVLFTSVLVSAVVATLAFALPMAAKTAEQSRKRAGASALASHQMAELMKQPYDTLVTTESKLFSKGNPTCDCRQAIKDSAIPVTQADEAGMSYQMVTCINYVRASGIENSPWTSQCMEQTGDTGYKKIYILVRWMQDDQTQIATQNGLVSRY